LLVQPLWYVNGYRTPGSASSETGRCGSRCTPLPSPLASTTSSSFSGIVKTSHRCWPRATSTPFRRGPRRFPNGLIEGMAAGLPVVASGVGGMLELVSDRRNGLLVPSDDAPALAASLIELMEMPALANAVANRRPAHDRGPLFVRADGDGLHRPLHFRVDRAGLCSVPRAACLVTG
jgi:hypothetical protein